MLSIIAATYILCTICLTGDATLADDFVVSSDRCHRWKMESVTVPFYLAQTKPNNNNSHVSSGDGQRLHAPCKFPQSDPPKRGKPSVPARSSDSVPTLVQLAADKLGPDASSVALGGGSPDQVKAVQAAPIKARGRVEQYFPPVLTPYGSRGMMRQDAPARIDTNLGGIIDGARLHQYDPDTRTVRIKAVHSTIPSFWIELEFTIDQLESWIAGSQ